MCSCGACARPLSTLMPEPVRSRHPVSVRRRLPGPATVAATPRQERSSSASRPGVPVRISYLLHARIVIHRVPLLYAYQCGS
jgi:hypothetical protein